LNFIQQKNLQFLYNDLSKINPEELSRIQQEYYNTYKTTQNLIESYCERQLEYTKEIEECKKSGAEIQPFVWSKYININIRF
jgi:hypothetical protein